MIANYPLSWPEGWRRTPVGQQRRAQFVHYRKRLTIFQGAERVMEELKRLGVNQNDVVISTNVRTRLDGMPRSDQKEPDDHGAAVYWRDCTAPGNPMRCMAIDRYSTVADNLAAIGATLESALAMALRVPACAPGMAAQRRAGRLPALLGMRGAVGLHRRRIQTEGRGAMTDEQIAKRVVDGIEARLGKPDGQRDGLRLYCATCCTYLDGNPLDADGMVVLIHAFAEHRLVERETEAATVRREVSA